MSKLILLKCSAKICLNSSFETHSSSISLSICSGKPGGGVLRDGGVLGGGVLGGEDVAGGEVVLGFVGGLGLGDNLVNLSMF